MATLYTHQDSNVRKTWVLMTLFLGVVIALGFIFAQVYDSQAIIWFAIILSLGMNFFSYWYSDAIALRVSGAKEIDREQYPELWRVTENLSITAGLPMPRLYIINDSAPNAFATGRNAKNAAVAVTTGLLAILDRNELEGVIAHELSHIGNKDILLQTVVVVLVGFIALLADMFLRMQFWGGGRDRDSGRAGIIILIVGIVLSILAPIAATLIQLAISRKREFLADASGALLTRYPEGLASALEKISGNTKPLDRANGATAHLFISNPFGSKGAKRFHRLFMTHPPAQERIAALRGIEV